MSNKGKSAASFLENTSNSRKRKQPSEETIPTPKGLGKSKKPSVNFQKTLTKNIIEHQESEPEKKKQKKKVDVKKPLEEQSQSQKPETGKSMMDDLFSTIGVAKKNKEIAEKKQAKLEEKKKAREAAQMPDLSNDMGFSSNNAEGRKRTDEGFLIYSEEELKLNEGGGTELCPWDCECCH